MAESSYWKSFWRNRVSRRRLLGSAAVGGAGLAAAAVVGCDGGGDGGGGGGGGGSANVLRYQGFDALVLDSFDPHHTQFGPLYSGHSAVFSKLYKYASHSEQLLVPDLAEGFPEIIGDPNAPTEFIIHLRRGVTFHDPASVPADVRGQLSIKDAAQKFPGLPGRELTADDVVWTYERQKNEDSPRFSTYYRSSQYKTMEKIEAIDDYTVKITTAEPIAPMLHFLGDTNAFILPREVVDEGQDTLDFAHSEPQSRMIGTGPFMWGELKSLQDITVFRNPDWFARDDLVDPGVPSQPDTESGLERPSDLIPHDARRQFVAPPQGATGRPYLDGYVAYMIVDNATMESLFRAKRLDVAMGAGDPQWVFDIKDEQPELEFLRRTISGWVNSRFKVADKDTGEPCVPWGDPRLRKAIHLAADRQQVMDFIWAGEAAMTAPVGPAIKKWALPYEELLTLPGYRTAAAEREEDLALARQLYEEAGSPELEFTFADVPDYIKDFAPDFVDGLRLSIGANVKDEVIRSYPIIAEQLLKGCDQMKATWGFDNGWIDLDDWLYPYFKTGASKNSFGVSDPEMDKLLDAQRREFDEEKRREIGFQIQRYLLGVKPDGSGPLDLKPNTAAFARLDYATLIAATVAWPYFKNRYTAPWFGNNHWIANEWLDRDDPSFAGRA